MNATAFTRVDECWRELKDRMAAMGTQVTVTMTPPPASPYNTEPLTCPHGVTYWIKPTSEQIATWVRDGVE